LDNNCGLTDDDEDSDNQENNDSNTTGTDTNKKPSEKTLPEQGYDTEAIFNDIVNDPDMKKAFFEQPSFWQSFVAALRGKKAPGKGIIMALDNYYKKINKDLEKKIGQGWESYGNVKFNPTTEGIKVPYTETKKDNETKETTEVETYFNLPINTKFGYYEAKIRRHRTTKSGKVLSTPTGKVDGTTKKPLSLFIVVESITNQETIKKCSLIIAHSKATNIEENNKGRLNDVLIEFYDSEGYTPPRGKKPNTPNTNI
jgi:hypothetical protein